MVGAKTRSRSSTADVSSSSHKIPIRSTRKKARRQQNNSRRRLIVDTSVDNKNALTLQNDSDSDDSDSQIASSEHSAPILPRRCLLTNQFNEQNCEMFFVHAEEKFADCGVTNQKLKYFSVFENLRDDHVMAIKSRLPDINSRTCYDELKKVLIDYYGKTEVQKFSELRETLRKGMPPKFLYQQIHEAIVKDPVTEAIRMHLFLNNLPDEIAYNLSAFPDESLDQLLKRAESLFERATGPCYDERNKVLIDYYGKTERQKLVELRKKLRKGTPPKFLYQQIHEAIEKDPKTEAICVDLFLNNLPDKIAFTLSAHPDDSLDQLLKRAESLFERATQIQSGDTSRNFMTNFLLSEEQMKSPPIKMASDKKFQVEMNSSDSTLANISENMKSMKIEAIKSEASSDGLTSNWSQPNRILLPNNHCCYPSRDYNRPIQGRGGYRNSHRRWKKQTYKLNGVLVCYYHYKFGDEAENCVLPCFFLQSSNLTYDYTNPWARKFSI